MNRMRYRIHTRKGFCVNCGHRNLRSRNFRDHRIEHWFCSDDCFSSWESKKEEETKVLNALEWKLTRMAKKFLKDNPDVKELIRIIRIFRSEKGE